LIDDPLGRLDRGGLTGYHSFVSAQASWGQAPDDP